MIRVVSVSGGKDSTATALVAMERHAGADLRFVFADTGNEHPTTYEYVLEYLPSTLGIKVDVVKASLAEQIAARRMFVARDQRTGRKYKTKEIDTGVNAVGDDGEPLGWTIKRVVRVGGGYPVRHSNKAKRRILAALHPTGNPYLDLCMFKGRFPSRRAQFCTQFLKTEPLVDYQLDLIDRFGAVESWQGVRADESPNRAKLPERENRGGNLTVYRPILRWNVEMVFAKLREHGVKPNALYTEGMSRVGCMPCINAAKVEVREIAARFPEQVARIAEWERIVSACSKRGAASFFAAPNDGRGDLRGRTIYAYVKWSRTGRGGRQELMNFTEPLACASAYGLCE